LADIALVDDGPVMGLAMARPRLVALRPVPPVLAHCKGLGSWMIMIKIHTYI
jgi:hypothetical protein